MKAICSSLVATAWLAFSVLLPFAETHACTGVGIQAEDGSMIVGRTLEFGTPTESSIVAIPAGTEMIGDTPKGQDTGLKFTTQYGFVGANGLGDKTLILDGVNEKGLVVGLFYFPDYAQYAEPTDENAAKGMGIETVGAWMLGSFATVEEVRDHVKDIAVLPVELPALKAVPGAHFRVVDAEGNCITIEPIGGELLVHDNPIRVLTNSPEFPWMLTNLNNYLNQTAQYPKNLDLNGLKLAPFGMGGGMVGIPGDFTPPSRFVRMTFFSQSLPKIPSAEGAIAAAFHLLNNFDLPVGVAQPPAGTAESDPDYTTWTGVADATNLRYYWKTFGDQNIKHVDLKTALEAAEKGPLELFMGSQKPVYKLQSTDVTAELK